MTKRVGVALRLQCDKGAAQCEQGPTGWLASVSVGQTKVQDVAITFIGTDV